MPRDTPPSTPVIVRGAGRDARALVQGRTWTRAQRSEPANPGRTRHRTLWSQDHCRPPGSTAAWVSPRPSSPPPPHPAEPFAFAVAVVDGCAARARPGRPRGGGGIGRAAHAPPGSAAGGAGGQRCVRIAVRPRHQYLAASPPAWQSLHAASGATARPEGGTRHNRGRSPPPPGGVRLCGP